jgi:hypothetical protein
VCREHGGGEVREGGSGCCVAAGVLPLRSQAAWRGMEVAARKEAGYKKATGFSFFLFYFPPKCVTHVDGDAAESILTGTAELLRTPFWAHR